MVPFLKSFQGDWKGGWYSINQRSYWMEQSEKHIAKLVSFMSIQKYKRMARHQLFMVFFQLSSAYTGHFTEFGVQKFLQKENIMPQNVKDSCVGKRPMVGERQLNLESPVKLIRANTNQPELGGGREKSGKGMAEELWEQGKHGRRVGERQRKAKNRPFNILWSLVHTGSY